jgi:hypothetical protein
VTIVFSDPKGSTAMGEKLDSESLREVMTRYFDAMCVESNVTAEWSTTSRVNMRNDTRVPIATASY